MSPGAGNAPAATVDEAAVAKRFATLRARAALAGVQVHRAGDGGFVVVAWGRTRELPDIDAVEDWIKRFAGRSA